MLAGVNIPMGVTCSMPALRLLLNRTAIGIKAPITKAHIVMAINCVTERNTYPPGADDDADSLRRTSGVVPSFRSTHMALSGVGVAGNILRDDGLLRVRFSSASHSED